MGLLRIAGELLLDGSKFEKGLGKAEKQVKGFSGRVKKTTSSLGRDLGTVAGGIFSLGTLRAWTQEASQYAAGLTKMSEETGESIRRLQEWDFIAQRSGHTLERLVDGSRSLAENMQRALTSETADAAEGFAALGISMEDVAKNKNNLHGMFLLLSDALNKMGKGAESMAAMQNIMGDIGSELIPAIERYRELAKAVAAAGVVMDDFTVKRLADAEARRALARKQRRKAAGDVMDFFNFYQLGAVELFTDIQGMVLSAGDDKGISGPESIRLMLQMRRDRARNRRLTEQAMRPLDRESLRYTPGIGGMERELLRIRRPGTFDRPVAHQSKAVIDELQRIRKAVED